MSHSRFPRVFVLTSLLLCFLVTYTTLYLYHRVPASYSISNPQATPLKDSDIVLEGAGVIQNIDGHVFPPAPVATADKGAAPVSTDVPAVPPPETLSHTGGPEDGSHGLDQKLPSELTDAAGPPVQVPQILGGPPEGDSQGQQIVLLPDPKECPSDMAFLVRASVQLGLTERVRYSRRRIRPVFSNQIDRDEVVNITEPLVQNDVEVDLWDCWDADIVESPPIKLHVPKPYAEESFAHLIFGVATEYNRLKESISTSAHWLSGTDAQLVAVVADASQRMPGEMEQLEQAFAEAGVNASLVRPIDDAYTTSQNHFTVLVDMLERGSPETQWYGLLDDDTFFPSLTPLSNALAAVDHTTDAYVGTLSEDFNAIRTFGFMAYGGAGAYLSPPLAKKLGDQSRRCIEEAKSVEGDIIIRDCVYTNSRAKLTILPGLYQQDMKVDASGFFEAGLRPLNLHHWKSWYSEPVDKMAAAAKFCGDCFLQRWRFGTDTVLSNGYSIATYRDGVDTVDLQTVEGTWMSMVWNTGYVQEYDFSIGPLRQPYGPGEKRSYKLMDVEFTERGPLKQLYVLAGNPEAGELDEVVELIWEKQ
ncbi:Uu.00g036770.m01.CDS01 [Anthostomella pinea]|uniref:Uu.00g036770.m01.CDS01 n=1 Tax=Anthostomella pinea TaxID=933095 RepID=A0AAI8V9H7_9PEZI|nr:Uu.00g036770.m01.CDS01 [Anthostomella pinea]